MLLSQNVWTLWWSKNTDKHPIKKAEVNGAWFLPDKGYAFVIEDTKRRSFREYKKKVVKEVCGMLVTDPLWVAMKMKMKMQKEMISS